MPNQNTKPSEHPQAVMQEIERLAQNIVVARKRRGETQAQWAAKLGVSQPTMARIERGDPAVAMASYVMCMWLVQPHLGLADLISPINDHAALEREVNKVRQRSKPVANTGALPYVTTLTLASQSRKESPVVASEPSPASSPAGTRRRTPGTKEAKNPTAQGLAALLSKTLDQTP